MQDFFSNSNVNIINHDKEWMNILLSKIGNLSVDNNWVCAFNHFPFDKIFLKIKNGKQCNEISIQNTDDDCNLLDEPNMVVFSNNYDQFFQTLKLATTDTKKYVRKAEIMFDEESRILWTFLEKLHGNYTRISLQIPSRND